MSDCRHNAPDRGLKAGDVQTQRQQSDELAREALLDKLVDCLYSFDGDTDTSAIDRCLEELEAAGEVTEDFDVEQGLKAFHERFGTAIERETKAVERKPFRYRRLLARTAIIAATLFALVFTMQATGFDIFGAIARWTSEQFSFEKGEDREQDPSLTYVSLQDALDDCDITEKLSPTEFPEGSELFSVRIREEREGVLISAKYTIGESVFFISLRKTSDTPYSEVEIEDPNIEPYFVNGIEHHLMADVRQQKATWYNGGWECRISGDLSREDMLMMIDSIYEGEST